MTPDAPDPALLLREARVLDKAQDYGALVALLEGTPREAFVVEPELGFLLADVLRRVGRGSETIPLLDRLEETSRLRGNDRLNRRRLNLLGMVKFEVGDIDEAVAAWEELAEAATRQEDREFEARAQNNLGVVFTLRDRSEEALAAYGRANTSYHALGYLRGMAQTHHNIGITYRELGFFDDAEQHFKRAASYAAASDARDETARVDQERALLFFLRGDSVLAKAVAERARDAFHALGDRAGAGEASHVIGLVAMDSGLWDEAMHNLKSAIQDAQESGMALLQAESLEAMAAIEETMNDNAQAELWQAEASQIFERLGAQAWGDKRRARARDFARRGKSR